MPLYDTYAKRKRRAERAGEPDVYSYNEIPDFLKKQVALVLDAAIGIWAHDTSYFYRHGNKGWTLVDDIMTREHESYYKMRGNSNLDTPRARFLHFVRNASDVDEWLSIVEVACRLLSALRSEPSARGATESGPRAVDEINARLQEHSVGYQFENGEIIRVDSQFTHAEIIKPALALLTKRGFETANDDFMTAHRHYRNHENKDAVVAANRAFESALKAVFKLNGWEYGAGDRASDLVKKARQSGLFPDYLDSGFDSYIAMMKTGLPNVRNNAGGHGSGPADPEVPAYLARYAIDMTAANIVLIATAAEGRAT